MDFESLLFSRFSWREAASSKEVRVVRDICSRESLFSVSSDEESEHSENQISSPTVLTYSSNAILAGLLWRTEQRSGPTTVADAVFLNERARLQALRVGRVTRENQRFDRRVCSSRRIAQRPWADGTFRQGTAPPR